MSVETIPGQAAQPEAVEPEPGLSGWGEVKRGIIASIPMMIGFIPFGLVLGAQAQQKGFPVLGVPMLTGFSFAGGAEYAVMELWSWPPHIFLIVAVTLLVNSRHILMSAVLAPLVRHLPKRKVLPALFFMCDESWAIALADAARKREDGKTAGFSLPFYIGAALALYGTWVSFTTLGAVVGPLIGDVRDFGFDMAFPAVFFVLLKGMWKNVRSSLPWAVSLVVALLTYLYVPGAWYVPAGALAGVISALVLSEVS